jgi:prepilin-type N-terminal cleavage/methylation domain-containing protein
MQRDNLKKKLRLNNNAAIDGAMLSGGFTLIEVLVSLLILTIGVVFIFEFIFSSAVTLKHIENRVNAYFFMNQQRWTADQLVRGSANLADYGDTVVINGLSCWSEIDMQKSFGLSDLFGVNIKIGWQEGKKHKSLWIKENIRRK